MEVRVAEVVAVIERDKMVRNQDLIRLANCGVPALNLWSESGHDWECFCKLIKEKVMRESLENVKAGDVVIKHCRWGNVIATVTKVTPTQIVVG